MNQSLASALNPSRFLYTINEYITGINAATNITVTIYQALSTKG